MTSPKICPRCGFGKLDVHEDSDGRRRYGCGACGWQSDWEEIVGRGDDDGTAARAAEIAAGWIARAWYRRTVDEKGNGGELMLSLADAARSHITPEQWKKLGR